jgi:hypothetical protein
LPTATASRTLSNLGENPRIAVTVSLPRTHRTLQLKGGVVNARPARDDERPLVERRFAEFAACVEEVGVSPWVTATVTRWPCWAVEFRVEDLFVQTPGPRAGQPLGGTRA